MADRMFNAWFVQKRRRARAVRALSVSLVLRGRSVPDSLSVVAPVKMTTASINDAGIGVSVLSLDGADAADFELDDGTLFLSSGVTLTAGTPKVVDIVLTNDARPDPVKNTFTLTVTA